MAPRIRRFGTTAPHTPPAGPGAPGSSTRTPPSARESAHPRPPRLLSTSGGARSGQSRAICDVPGSGPPPSDDASAQQSRSGNTKRGKQRRRRPDATFFPASPDETVHGSLPRAGPVRTGGTGDRYYPTPPPPGARRPRATDYLEPISTTRRARPRRRRRFSTARPPRVAIRARNPCLFFRFRFRGL
jgi:hypothetical protein